MKKKKGPDIKLTTTLPVQTMESKLHKELVYTPVYITDIASYWIVIILLLSRCSSSSAIIDNDNDTNSYMSPMMNDQEHRNVFKPTSLPSGPLFSTTSSPSAAMISKDNFTLTLETYVANPYIRTTTSIYTPSYQITSQLIDYKSLAIDLHNANKFLDEHSKQVEYQNQLGFKSLKYTKGETPAFNTNAVSPFEYFKYKTPLSFADCPLVCAMLGSNLPWTKQHVDEASKIFNVTNHMWVNTTNTATVRSDWTWKNGLYKYTVHLNGTEIYPTSPETDISMNCQAYKGGKPIPPEKIGFLYRYYNSDNTYDNHQPRRIQTAISTDKTCKILVIEPDHAMVHHKDDESCICVRNKTSDIIVQHQREANRIKDEIRALNESRIENWRYKTSSNNVLLDDINNEYRPRYVDINPEKVNYYRNHYIANKDVTEIKIDRKVPKTLKMKDMKSSIFKGMMKSLISNPALLKKLHKSVEEKLAQKNNILMMDTPQMLSNSKYFAAAMNEQFPNFRFTRDDHLLRITPKHKKQIDWKTLTNMTDFDAIEGIRYASQSLYNAEQLKTIVIPSLIFFLNLQMKPFQRTDLIARESKTIVEIQYHNSYAEIRCYMPIYIEKRITLYDMISLPHGYDERSGKHISKRIPSTIVADPEVSNMLNLTSVCDTEVLKNDGILDKCQNVMTYYNDIQLLMKIGQYSLFFLTKIGETSISCHGTKMHWFDFKYNVNIILMHSSCFLQTTENNLQIIPTSSELPNKEAVVYIMYYNFSQQWIPDDKVRFIFLISVAVLLGLIILSLIACVVFIARKKPWVCKIQPSIKYNHSTNASRNTVNVFDLNELESETEDTEDKPINAPTNGAYRNYKEDYEQYSTEEEEKQEPIETFYATVNKNRKPTTPSLPRTPVSIPKYAELPRTPNSVHWRFDNKPIKHHRSDRDINTNEESSLPAEQNDK